MIATYILKNKLSDIEDIKQFSEPGYVYIVILLQSVNGFLPERINQGNIN
jgi:hypothetical protein